MKNITKLLLAVMLLPVILGFSLTTCRAQTVAPVPPGSYANSGSTTPPPTDADNIRYANALLKYTTANQKYIDMGDMFVSVGEMRAYRDRLVAKQKPPTGGTTNATTVYGINYASRPWT